MPNSVEYLVERLEKISPYYFKVGGKLMGLRHDIEELQDGASCKGFNPAIHANEMFLWVAEKYKSIDREELLKNPETACLQDIPRKIVDLGQNIQNILKGDRSNETLSSAHSTASEIIEKGHEFRKFIDSYTRELEELGHKELAWKYRHRTTHNFGNIL